MRTKEEKQIIYDIIKTIEAKTGIDKNNGYTQTQLLKILRKHFPFVENYYFMKAKRYGRVRDDIDLMQYLAGTYSELTKAYYVRRYLDKGYSKKWIKDHLGEDYYDTIFTIQAREKRKEINQAKGQYIKMHKIRTKKVNLDFIISAIKHSKSLVSAWAKLRDYVQTRTAKGYLKRYGLTPKDVVEKDKDELVSIAVKTFLSKKLKLIDYESFLKCLYDYNNLTELANYSKHSNKEKIRDFLKQKLLTRATIDKMIIQTKTFENFKKAFEKHIYNHINNAYFIENNYKAEMKEFRKKLKEKIVKDIETFDKFLEVAKQCGYTIAIRKCKDRNKIYKHIFKQYGNVANFKMHLKNEMI